MNQRPGDPSAPSWCSLRNGRLVLSVHVQPGARRTEVCGLHGEALKIRLAAPPVGGKANDELVRFVADVLGISRSRVALVRGQTSRDKVIAVEVADPEKARTAVERLLQDTAHDQR